jgi:uncharacterized protein with von Willebrand factor type A (vWA) domain
MALDLNAFFNNLKSYTVEDDDNTQVDENQMDSALYNKSLSDMTEEEKEQFYESKDYKEYSAGTEIFNDSYSVNYSGKNVQEIFGLSDKSNKYSYNCFDFIETDHEDYLDIVDFSPEMQNTIAEGEALLPTFKYLHEDIFMSLYQYNATVLPPERMHIQSWMNRNILSQLINTPVFITLRKTCRCDLFNAGIGTEIIGKQAIEILKKELAKIKDFQKKKEALEKLVEQEEQVDSLAEELDEMEELLDEMRMSGQEGSQEFEELQERYGNSELNLQQARALAEQLAEDCEELVETSDDLVDNFTVQMDNSIIDATSEVQQVSGYVQAWGLGEGNDIKVPFGLKKSALERIRNSEYLRKFTDMIGKYKECAVTEQKKKTKASAIEIKSVKVGDKIEDALPSDKLNLCNNVTKKDFYRRMTQGQLMSYDKESQKQKNKGPIIVCIDQSGSMHGDKDMWAKALAVGILEVAQLQKREFACIPYDSSCRKTTIIHKDEISPDKIIGIAEERATGGTSFEAPLKEASKLIEDSNFKEADVVFITDGDCSVSDDFRRKFKQLKEDKEFRTMGVLVDYGHTSRTTLDDFCDSVTTVSQIADAKNANSDVNKMIFGSL